MFGERGYPAEFDGSFHENVRALLEFGQFESGACGGRASWSFQLEARRHPLLHLFLFVVEEPVELSVELHCKHCRYIDIPGHQIMELWDRLCTSLRARKVSLRDTAQKKGMDLRLLHALAYSKPWFGHWGYKYGRGTFGVTQKLYQNALKAIQSIPLSLLSQIMGVEFCKTETKIILARYQVLSGHSLVTLGDLFHFMIELKSRLPKQSSKDSNYPGIMSDSSCRWSPKRVEMAIHVVVEALKRAEARWVSRQQVRDVARAYIGDTGLLDFVLKSLGNHIVGKYFVRRCLNPVTKVLEYCLEDVSRAFPKQDGSPFIDAKLKPQHKISWDQIMRDILYMYRNILKEDKSIVTANGRLSSNIPLASRIILDTKYFVKDYRGDAPSEDESMKPKIYCAVILADQKHEYETVSDIEKASMTPYECFELKNGATFDELKIEVEKTFREIYLGLRHFVVQPMINMDPKGSDLVFNKVTAGGKIAFEGIREVPNNGIYEGWVKRDLVVDCPCGTKDDDGERMVSCDICQVWQHTRCVQIPNNQQVPTIFLCNICEQDILQFPSLL
ncbi:PHD finger protein MALE STERILITY 1-like [Dorcoceras hygrometricum]|uniref:PHD finger protein MALE STERILITY 1-like n=1 Tax=Dorcoceras hygrometricum TaxID=472368 RepID=A0A2Z7CKG3_9LAMI|nr:PHD finger protein MALE STERILITY 1-like [Dorcoceras hygrometricum]